MALITTERGTRIQLLDVWDGVKNHSSPYAYRGWVHLHLVVQGLGQKPVHCEPMQILKEVFDRNHSTMSLTEFWEDVGAQALMNQQALDEHRADPTKWSNRAA